ncbi:MAG: hypothetical protein QG608_1169, partial [Actinomycetota bacterium]|nr:hypothetical protein [Actinomycetota bacterium]
MTLQGLLEALAGEPGLDRARRLAAAGSTDLEIVCPLGARPPALAALAAAPPRGAGRPLLVVTATGRECEDLASALRCYLPAEGVAEFPSWETLPHERLSPRSDTVGRRLAVLRRLTHPSPDDPVSGPIQVLVAPIRAVIQPVVTGLGELTPVGVNTGQTAELDTLVEQLASAAYTRVDMVEHRGEFAVRGGILDVFPPTEDHPLRVEFWGDTVEEIRWFSVADQRSLEIADRGLWAPPCREILLTREVRQRAADLALALPGFADMLEKISQGIAVEGMESLAPLLADGMQPVIDLLPTGTAVILVEPERIRTRTRDLVATSEEFRAAAWATAAGGGQTPLDPAGTDLSAASYWSLARLREHALAAAVPWWSVTGLARDTELPVQGASDALGDTAADADDAARTVVLGLRETRGYRGETEKALTDLRNMVAEGWSVVATTEGSGPAARMVE